ncbi:MAG TPA: nicotinate-nucleotide adenylyltransferase [Gemmatimonadaceae bacterium]|nr:nicotinate-nucleotide adenylyltransferase [Gemmatimonadaceae bacterium]
MRASTAGDDGHAEALTTVRLGLFGGTFDPPHVGHLLAASDAFDKLHLDRVAFVPAASQPFKQGAGTASTSDRLAMLRLSVGSDPRFTVDSIEIDRGGLSYTVDTLDALAARDPESQRFLLIGEDLAEQVGSWRQSERIAELATIVVLVRGDDAGAGTSIRQTLPLSRIATRRVDVSSSEIRARVRAGLPLTGFVTEAVADYIRSASLYR